MIGKYKVIVYRSKEDAIGTPVTVYAEDLEEARWKADKLGGSRYTQEPIVDVVEVEEIQEAKKGIAPLGSLEIAWRPMGQAPRDREFLAIDNGLEVVTLAKWDHESHCFRNVATKEEIPVNCMWFWHELPTKPYVEWTGKQDSLKLLCGN